MHFFKTLTFFSCLLLLSLSSCFSPRSIVKMETHPDEEITWNYGRQIVTTANGELEAQVFFDEFTKKHLIFDVEITNWGEEAVLISPEAFYLELPGGQKIKSFDPEREIFNSQVKKSREEAGRKNAAVLVGVAAVATVVAVAASDDDDWDDDDDGDGIDINAPIFINAGSTNPPPPLPFLPPDMMFWEDYALRKTTLQPRFKANGKVVFRRDDLAKALTLNLPIGEMVLHARFNQSVFQP